MRKNSLTRLTDKTSNLNTEISIPTDNKDFKAGTYIISRPSEQIFNFIFISDTDVVKTINVIEEKNIINIHNIEIKESRHFFKDLINVNDFVILFIGKITTDAGIIKISNQQFINKKS